MCEEEEEKNMPKAMKDSIMLQRFVVLTNIICSEGKRTTIEAYDSTKKYKAGTNAFPAEQSHKALFVIHIFL